MLPAIAGTAAGRTAFGWQVFGRPWAVPEQQMLATADALLAAEAFDEALALFDDYTFHDAEQLDAVPVMVVWGSRDRLLLVPPGRPRAPRAAQGPPRMARRRRAPADVGRAGRGRVAAGRGRALGARLRCGELTGRGATGLDGRARYAAAGATPAERTGAGVSAEATMTITKAIASMTMPRASPGMGSPKTMMPPAMQEMFAAVPVIAMTGTASPS